jgi:hypothetical protein
MGAAIMPVVAVAAKTVVIALIFTLVHLPTDPFTPRVTAAKLSGCCVFVDSGYVAALDIYVCA